MLGLKNGIILFMGNNIFKNGKLEQVIAELNEKEENYCVMNNVNEDFRQQKVKILSKRKTLSPKTKIKIILMVKDGISGDFATRMLEEAKNKLFIVFGYSDNMTLVNLIPKVDRFEKLNAICQICKATACFRLQNVTLCSSCRNNERKKSE